MMVMRPWCYCTIESRELLFFLGVVGALRYGEHCHLLFVAVHNSEVRFLGCDLIA